MTEEQLLTLKQLGLDSEDADFVLEAWEEGDRALMIKAEKSATADRPVITITPAPDVAENKFKVKYEITEHPWKEEVVVDALVSRLFLIANLGQ